MTLPDPSNSTLRYGSGPYDCTCKYQGNQIVSMNPNCIVHAPPSRKPLSGKSKR